ncbi:MAG: MucR family transcriptional regulator [Acetobacteraceae bacterium]|nr:MucR family transcriptional regulator [Acetobacteraceae bacterium]
MPVSDDPILSLTAQIVSAHVEHNQTPATALPGLIREVYRALAGTGPSAGTPANQARPPLVTTRKASPKQTVFDDHLICMDCGLRMKMLKRHLQTVHNVTTSQYRTKWNLAGDYPMVAREYAA